MGLAACLGPSLYDCPRKKFGRVGLTTILGCFRIKMPRAGLLKRNCLSSFGTFFGGRVLSGLKSQSQISFIKQHCTFYCSQNPNRYYLKFREFKKRMDNKLPFYYWSLNECFSEGQPSFDERPVFNEDEVELRRHPLHLHRLRLNQREDSSIIVAGRAFLPVRNRTTIRQRMHCPVVDPAPAPGPN